MCGVCRAALRCPGWPEATANAARCGLDSTRRAAWHRTGRSPFHFVVLVWRPLCVALTTSFGPRASIPRYGNTSQRVEPRWWPRLQSRRPRYALTSNRLALTQPLKFNDEVAYAPLRNQLTGRPAAERRKGRREPLLFLRSYNVQSTATQRGLGARLGSRKSQNPRGPLCRSGATTSGPVLPHLWWGSERIVRVQVSLRVPVKP
jgi:hypothetical protein